MPSGPFTSWQIVADFIFLCSKITTDRDCSHEIKRHLFLGGSDGKESACIVGDLDSISGLERSPGEGMATHSSILAWRMPWTDHGVANSQTQLFLRRKAMADLDSIWKKQRHPFANKGPHSQSYGFPISHVQM